MKKLVSVIIFVFIFGFISKGYAEEKIKSIDGFRDIKFGMSQEKVRQTEIGRTQKVELFGEICEVEFEYFTLANGEDPCDLMAVSIDLTNCDETTIDKIMQLLKEKYEIAYVPSDKIIDIHEKRLKNYKTEELIIPILIFGFAGNQIAISVDKDDNSVSLNYVTFGIAKMLTVGFENMELEIKKPDFIEKLTIPKKTSKDDL